MRHPFWILNSSLLLVSLMAVGFIYFSRQEAPARQTLEPEKRVKPVKMETSKINISKIYEDDLFGTYQEMMAPQTADQVSPLPEPPSPLGVRIPEEAKPQFLEPLPITLRGIIIWSDDSKNRVTIADNRTNVEGSYRVGDRIEDAQLIRIFNNKVIFMRSNGQQEVLYLRERDAKLDPSFANIEGWDGVIQMTGLRSYTINAAELINRISSLGQLIDMVDVTTVYRQGESIGSRIGMSNAFVSALGLAKEDVITTINDIPATDTNNRMKIYNQISSLKTNDVIRVTLTRGGNEMTLTYTLQEIKQPHKKELSKPPQPSPERITKEQIEQLEKKHTFAPTVNELRQREKANMLEKGKRPTQNVLSNLNE